MYQKFELFWKHIEIIADWKVQWRMPLKMCNNSGQNGCLQSYWYWSTLNSFQLNSTKWRVILIFGVFRPKLTLGDGYITEEAWEYFVNNWKSYKTLTNPRTSGSEILSLCLPLLWALACLYQKQVYHYQIYHGSRFTWLWFTKLTFTMAQIYQPRIYHRSNIPWKK